MATESVPDVLQASHAWLVSTVESMTADMPRRQFRVSYNNVSDEAVFTVEIDRPAFGVLGGAAGSHAEAIRALARVVARAHGYRGRFDVRIRDLEA